MREPAERSCTFPLKFPPQLAAMVAGEASAPGQPREQAQCVVPFDGA